MSHIDPDSWPSNQPPIPLTGLAACLGVAFMIASLGGALCGWMIDQFGPTGAIVLWPMGFLSGCLVRRLPPCAHAGIILSIGLLLALVVGEILWIQTHIKDAEELSKAISVFPIFLVEYKVDVFFASIPLVFGILSALQTTKQ